MSPWTALFESLHSALIDELCERHPKPKPELGLPVHHSQWNRPDSLRALIWSCEVTLDGKGYAMIAAEPEFLKKLKLTGPELWQAILRRAGGELSRRGIKPVLDPLDELKGQTKPSNEIKRLVWIPIRLPAGSCFLGLAV